MYLRLIENRTQIYIETPITEEHQIYICNILENARNNNNHNNNNHNNNNIRYKIIMWFNY